MDQDSSRSSHIEPVELSGTLAEPWSCGKLLRMLTLFGPAAIVASVAIGAGETIVVVRAGSWCAYDLLWVVLAGAIVKGVFVTYMLDATPRSVASPSAIGSAACRGRVAGCCWH